MEGIDLAGVVDSDFQGIQINFAPPPHPAGFANFRGAGRAKTCFFVGRGGAHTPAFQASNDIPILHTPRKLLSVADWFTESQSFKV